ncbi:MAG: sugar transferase [Candidatus Dadabacteria bacterium]|nr:MAG: sugar transferase [Candidatus Dadabacteria bacterium]
MPEAVTPKRRFALTILKTADLAVVTLMLCLSLALTAAGAEPASWLAALRVRVELGNVLFVAAYILIWHIVLSAYGLYLSYRMAAAAREWRDLSFAVLTGVGILIPLAAIFHFEYVTPAFLSCFTVLALLGLGIERRLIRAAARSLRIHGHNLRNVVIVGDGEGAMSLAADLTKRHDFGYHVLSVLDVRTIIGSNGDDPCSAVVSRVADLIERNPVDEVFLTVSLGNGHELVEAIIALCEEQGTMVRVVARIADLSWGRTVVDEVGGKPVLTVFSGPPEAVGLVVKRLIDIVGSILGLIVCAPLFAVVAVAIRLDSPGPIFFIQERVGYNRRRFRTYKFRTMIDGAQELQPSLEHLNEARGPIFKIRDDPRITRVGKWLRRLSIDELPQLINVLKGDMSLVGPRPLPIRDVERIDVRWHKRRFSVKPGMTGMWQASGRALDFDEWVKADMAYIDQWSLALDLKILLRTLPAVVSGAGAH